MNSKAIVNSRTPLHRNILSITRRWQLYLMILPALVYVILFSYKPMYGVIIAFQNYKLKLGIAGSSFVGFKNFDRLFKSYWFPVILKNTVTISGLSILLGFPAPIILALMVNEIHSNSVRKTFQVVSYAPHFISTVVMCSMIIMFLSPSTGLIGKALGDSSSLLQSENNFRWIYVLSEIWQETGWGAIIYYATLSSVDKNLLEAAMIDGANRIQRIIHINIPVLVPTIIIMFILRCGNILSVGYEKVFLLQNPVNLPGSEVISTYVYKMGLQQSDFSFSTATGLLNSVVNCFFLITVNLLSKKISGSSLW